MFGRYWWEVVRRLDRPGWRICSLFRAPSGSASCTELHVSSIGATARGSTATAVRRFRMRDSGAPRLQRFSPETHATTALWVYTPGQGDVVFDVGAGVGSETLLFSRLVGHPGASVSIEAHRALQDESSSSATPTGWPTSPHCRSPRLRETASVTISDLANHVRNTTLAAADEGNEVPARRLETVASSLTSRTSTS